MEAAAKRKAVVKELTSEKREKLVRISEGRTINAIRAIRVIAKLGNKSHYPYDEADVKKIVAAPTMEIEAMKTKMGDKTGRDEVGFKLQATSYPIHYQGKQ